MKAIISIISAPLFIFLFACNGKNSSQIISNTKDSTSQGCACNVEGIVKYQKEGTLLFNLPDGHVMDTIYSDDIDSAEQVGPSVIIVSSKDEWLLVYPTIARNVKYKIIPHKGRKYAPDTSKLFWIKGNLVFTNPYNPDSDTSEVILYKEPNKISIQINKTTQSHRVKIIECCKDWIYIEGENKEGKKVKGWLPPENQCANPYTACYGR